MSANSMSDPMSNSMSNSMSNPMSNSMSKRLPDVCCNLSAEPISAPGPVPLPVQPLPGTAGPLPAPLFRRHVSRSRAQRARKFSKPWRPTAAEPARGCSMPPRSSPTAWPASRRCTKPRRPRCQPPCVCVTEAAPTTSTAPARKPSKSWPCASPARAGRRAIPVETAATSRTPGFRKRSGNPEPDRCQPQSPFGCAAPPRSTASPGSAIPASQQEENKRLWGGAMMDALAQMGMPVQPVPSP